MGSLLDAAQPPGCTVHGPGCAVSHLMWPPTCVKGRFDGESGLGLQAKVYLAPVGASRVIAFTTVQSRRGFGCQLLWSIAGRNPPSARRVLTNSLSWGVTMPSPHTFGSHSLF